MSPNRCYLSIRAIHPQGARETNRLLPRPFHELRVWGEGRDEGEVSLALYLPYAGSRLATTSLNQNEAITLPNTIDEGSFHEIQAYPRSFDLGGLPFPRLYPAKIFNPGTVPIRFGHPWTPPGFRYPLFRNRQPPGAGDSGEMEFILEPGGHATVS